MSEVIASRQTIAARAEQAVLAKLTAGIELPCPYPEGCTAHAEYEASYARYWEVHTAPEEVEGGC